MKQSLRVMAIAALMVASWSCVLHGRASTHHYAPYGYGYGHGSPSYDNYGGRGYGGYAGGHYRHRQTYVPVFGLWFGR